jgi:GWxTD domain-containing protein
MNKPFKHIQRTGLWWLSLIILTTIVSGCRSYQPAVQSAYRQLYRYSDSPIHPEYVVYHRSDDTTRIYFRVKSGELLYSRPTGADDFRAVIQLNLKGEISLDNARRSLSDSLTFEDFSGANSDAWILSFIDISIKPGETGIITIDMMDKSRQSVVSNDIYINKSDNFSKQNFIASSEGRILFNEFVREGQQIDVESRRNAGSALRLVHAEGDVKLPPPPFSGSLPSEPAAEDMREDTPYSKDSTGGFLSFTAREGRYVIFAGKEARSGKQIMVSHTFFPEIGTVEALIYPMRYITSKTEFETIEKNSDPKKLIDNFWIECAGSKERARDLIRVYFERVQEANYYFSSFTEGWRTDRGMVHIVFGRPDTIRRTGDTETWIYGEEGNISSITFIFKRTRNAFSDNVYQLMRDPVFRSAWERMVTTWRNGRVYSD